MPNYEITRNKRIISLTDSPWHHILAYFGIGLNLFIPLAAALIQILINICNEK